MIAKAKAEQAEESFIDGATWKDRCELTGDIWFDLKFRAKQHANRIREESE